MSIHFPPQNAENIADLYKRSEGGTKGYTGGLLVTKAGAQTKKIKYYLRVEPDGDEKKLGATPNQKERSTVRVINDFMLKFSQSQTGDDVKIIRGALKTVITEKVKKLKGFRGLLRRLFTSINKDLNRLEDLSKEIDIAYESISKTEMKKIADKHIKYNIAEFKDDLDKLNNKTKPIQKNLESIKNEILDMGIKQVETELDELNEILDIPTTAVKNVVWAAEHQRDYDKCDELEKIVTKHKELEKKRDEYKKEITPLEKDVRLVKDKIKAMKKLLKR